jgi:predicted GIY-YIG superfamily endonuclease
MTAELDPRVLRRLTDMHALYRMFDPAGRLLYVGVTGDLARRLGSHVEKRWFPLVTTISLEWFPTRAAAALAEHRAIQAERPRLNVAGKNGRPYQPPGSQRLPQTVAAAAAAREAAEKSARDAAARRAAEREVAEMRVAELGADGPIALREAIEMGIIRCSLDALRRASSRPGFPPATGMRSDSGRPKLYAVSDLHAWAARKTR